MGELATTSEVLEPGQRSLEELADGANREGRLVVQAGSAMIEHVIQMGELLLAAQAQVIAAQAQGERASWMEWLAENFDYGYTWAASSMRAARYQEQVRASGATSLQGVKRALSALEAPQAANGRYHRPAWMEQEAIRLRKDGVSIREIARELGVSGNAVRYWTDTNYRQRSIERSRRAAKQRAVIRRELREQERVLAIQRAVKKAGAATAEAWAMAERMQDVLAQAQRETENREARRALSEAGVHYRKMRDEIVRALGVA